MRIVTEKRRYSLHASLLPKWYLRFESFRHEGRVFRAIIGRLVIVLGVQHPRPA